KTPSRPALSSPLAMQLTPTRPEATAPRPAPRVSPSILEPARPELFNFRFAAERNFKEKFERLKERRSSQEKILSGQDFRGRAESQLPLHPL
ncbi:MAG: hypothetical protein V3U22_01030, partial [Vicinamibacteria bacterium]